MVISTWAFLLCFDCKFFWGLAHTRLMGQLVLVSDFACALFNSCGSLLRNTFIFFNVYFC
jgi:hypothetical protein